MQRQDKISERTLLSEIVFPRFSKDEVELTTYENQTSEMVTGSATIKKGIIHFYFCTEGMATFGFGPHYSREIKRNFNYFFYNPDKDLPFELSVASETKIVYLSISIHALHHLFTHEGQGLPILDRENAGRKFYDEREIPPSLRVVLNSVFNVQLNESAARVYFQGKALELLGLYFSNRIPDIENCPFLNNEETVRKIKHAKEYLLKQMDAPPGLKALARISGLNEFQLKAGFKEVYGNTVYGYLLDQKMDQARLLLDSGKFQVNEVAYQMGYANTSHFIAAFRKKFGVTPKKYLMNR
jgi:AraC-like DNA-binding protein